MGGIRDFRDLLIWQKAMDLSEEVYRLSAKFPPQEVYGLSAQIRRSAVSLPSNIAEGHGRESPGEFARFLRIARGSLTELQTQLILAWRLGMVGEEPVSLMSHSEELARMLRGMQKSIESQIPASK